MSALQRKVKLYRRGKFTLMDGVIFIILTLMALLIVMPFYFSVMISFVTQQEYVKSPFILFPKTFTLDAYTTLLDGGSIFTGYKNTFFHIIFGMPLSLVITFALGYVFSSPNFPGKRFIMMFVLFTMMFSGGMIPSYMNIRELGLMNSKWAIVLSNLLSTYYAILVMSYIRTLPEALFESARLDGANETTILFKIVMPLCAPIIATIALFYLVDKWNEWYGSMLYLNRSSDYPLQLVLQNIVNTFQFASSKDVSQDAVERMSNAFSMGIKMAAVVLTMFPIMCVFPFLQKYFVKGITLGAVKE